jgi:hypothetical protein
MITPHSSVRWRELEERRSHPDGYELPNEPAPYRGLERFDARQKDYFFGREDNIRRLAKRLADSNFVAVGSKLTAAESRLWLELGSVPTPLR